MRVGLGLLGFLAGAMVGLLAAVLALFLWYDVLRSGDHGGDGLEGAATFMLLAPPLALAGGVAGAFWLARSARAGSKGVTIALLIVLLIFAAFFTLGPMFVL
jgi:hypothetical protein